MVQTTTDEVIYWFFLRYNRQSQVNYVYDMAGRLLDVCEPKLGTNNLIASFDYDKNGNREQLNCYHEGTRNGTKTSIDYSYNLDNMLTEFVMSNGPAFTLSNVTIDGLGRLRSASETITNTNDNTTANTYTYGYDGRSQLLSANIDINGVARDSSYVYRLDGNIDNRTMDGDEDTFGYTGDLMTGLDMFELTWDKNGNILSALGTEYVWNWDNKLRSAQVDDNSIACKYAPDGSRVYREKTVGETTTRVKYIVDVSGKYPVVLMELNSDNGNVIRSYVHANGQVLAQHNGGASRNFYLHDRLDSVRMVIDNQADVIASYTYDPFGNPLEVDEQLGGATNPYRFANYWWDEVPDEYFCNARWYHPYLGRFTSADPVRGRFKEPMSLHRYLYCYNDPIDHIDPSGEFWDMFARAKDASASAGALGYAREVVFSGATWLNAVYSGWINVWTGPDSVSDSAKFAIGFIGGAAEMQIGLRVNATAGAFVGSLITNTANELLAKDKSLGWAAIDIAVSTGLGGLADWMDPGGVEALEMFLIGLDADLILNASKAGTDSFSGT